MVVVVVSACDFRKALVHLLDQPMRRQAAPFD
jgi:hypothetical protein